MIKKFGGDQTINYSLSGAIVSLTGIVGLRLLGVDTGIWYYALFLVLIISAIIYSFFSIKKGLWLFNKIKEEKKKGEIKGNKRN